MKTKVIEFVGNKKETVTKKIAIAVAKKKEKKEIEQDIKILMERIEYLIKVKEEFGQDLSEKKSEALWNELFLAQAQLYLAMQKLNAI